MLENPVNVNADTASTSLFKTDAVWSRTAYSVGIAVLQQHRGGRLAVSLGARVLAARRHDAALSAEELRPRLHQVAASRHGGGRQQLHLRGGWRAGRHLRRGGSWPRLGQVDVAVQALLQGSEWGVTGVKVKALLPVCREVAVTAKPLGTRSLTQL